MPQCQCRRRPSSISKNCRAVTNQIKCRRRHPCVTVTGTQRNIVGSQHNSANRKIARTVTAGPDRETVPTSGKRAIQRDRAGMLYGKRTVIDRYGVCIAKANAVTDKRTGSDTDSRADRNITCAVGIGIGIQLQRPNRNGRADSYAVGRDQI